MSGVCKGNAAPTRNELRDALRRELSISDDRTIDQVMKELGEMGVYGVDDLKEVNKSDIESLSLEKIPQRNLRKFVDKLNGKNEPQSSSQSQNLATLICSRGSEESKVHLVGSTITLSTGDGGKSSSSGNARNRAVLGQGNVHIIAEDSPIFIDAGGRKKK